MAKRKKKGKAAKRDPIIQLAIDAAGGMSELARRIGVSPQAIYDWDAVPVRRALAVERATGGVVSRHRLRPDIYPVEE